MKKIFHHFLHLLFFIIYYKFYAHYFEISQMQVKKNNFRL